MKARAIWLAIPLMAGVAFAQSGGAAGSTGSTAEMKTMTYRGVLVDLACGAATASAGAPSGATGSANRSAGGVARGPRDQTEVDSRCRDLVHYVLSLKLSSQWEVRLPFFGTDRLHQ
ncbi:MAG: hypothetical protein HYX25_10460 [Candidatus Solibacter usitatus]|nr:hypothetical protein [Candidatus Solibacter usitatus]